MPTFAWDPKYETGIESIDGQHRELFRSAQKLHDAFQTGMTGEAISHTLNHLLIYCETHLEDEEVHMRNLSYPGIQAQLVEHRDLMTRVYHLRDHYLEGDKTVPLDLSLLVVMWFRRHIVEYDQQFADFIRAKRECGVD